MKITYNSTNYYLIECRNGYMLVDAGWHGKLDKFKKELESLNISLNQIKYIFLTHHHHDHAALVQDLKVLTNAQLIVHEKQIDFLTKGVTDSKKIKQHNWVLFIIDRLFSPFIKYNYKPIAIEQSDLIVDSEVDDKTLREIGIAARIIATPGHSMDSISILMDSGTAYVGDLAMSIMGSISKIPLPIEAEDYQQVNDSMKSLIDLGAKEFYPSHGKLIEKELIENVIK